MPVLNFPQRYMLLSKSWKFAAANQNILAAMIDADLSKRGDALRARKRLEDRVQLWRNGANANLDQVVIDNYIDGLGDYFEQKGPLKDLGMSKSDFIKEMKSSDDMAFLDFLGRTSLAPRLIGVLPRQTLCGMLATSREQLIDSATNERVYFFYRLGYKAGRSFNVIDDKLRFSGNKKDSKEALLVIRRIPARLRLQHEESDHLIYEEHYEDKLDSQQPIYTSLAAAYVYQHFLTIVSKDKRETHSGVTFVDASVAQVDLKQGLEHKDRWYPGVVAMRSDCTPYKDRWNPTAYRFVLRAAPNNMTWDNAKHLSETLPVADLSGDHKIDSADFQQFKPDGIDKPETWSRLVERLNIEDNLADLVVANGRHA